MDVAEIEEVGGAEMKEYIEKSMAFAVLVDFPGELSPENIGLSIARKAIDSLPTADVAPVRHGRWIDAESDDGCTVWHCSKCSYPIKTICGYPIYKYCPMCGALMNRKEDGHEVSEPTNG